MIFLIQYFIIKSFFIVNCIFSNSFLAFLSLNINYYQIFEVFLALLVNFMLSHMKYFFEKAIKLFQINLFSVEHYFHH